MPSGFHTWSQTGATNATADSGVDFHEGQAPSSLNDSSRNAMAVLAKWRDDNNGSLTTGGTTTAFTITSNTVFTTLALMHNQTLAFTMNATSGATPTLNVDGLGAKVIRNATGVALPTGALLSGSVYRATYNNSSGEWLLHNQAGVLPTDSVATASILNDAVTYAKMQNVAASSLVGNPTGGSTDPSGITLGQGLAFSGTTLVASTVVPTIQTLTSGTSATYTTPAGVKWLEVIVQGGGGGGGGGNQSSLSTAGGSTIFSTFTAGGGAGSSYTVAGAGGTASGGHINRVGSPGSPGSPPALNHAGQGGTGGSTIFGGGAAGISSNSTGASAPANTGCGGGGGGNTNGSLDGSGGNGGASGGTITAFINSPSATYTYTIGAGGAGAAGTSISASAGGSGGAGGSGVVVVIEHY